MAGSPELRRRMPRLDQRIRDEARAILDGRLDAEFALRDDLEFMGGEDRAHLGELAGIAGREHHASHRQRPLQPARASFCSAHSRPMPPAARSSSASSSSRRNAWPSAVPCTSMKAPPEFITTFMSVSASASSA